ncbi:Threonylcarbamoyladenosine tRNA methylthiotransferase [Anabarilius grahami]|uniref:Threonylcarbamoyladenosine tRNA methylthiotransferase n=1 Tax=Anabarilius grahami TaxID=495550 RepID=A0A3N0ZA77_ANAGA|nr:Threonylcarbamoyladenosine tRNA methylthiotransferase [Anabarilius grahami]
MAKILNHPRVYAFLHVPVQSASDSVLMDMKREYCCADFRRVMDFLKENRFDMLNRCRSSSVGPSDHSDWLFSYCHLLVRKGISSYAGAELTCYLAVDCRFVEDRIHHAGMDGLLMNCATGCRVDDVFTMDDLVNLISADTSGLRCGHVQLRIVFITPQSSELLTNETDEAMGERRMSIKEPNVRPVKNMFHKFTNSSAD